jgi:HPt (histidine-containing phosphotransfer) domain-containing protein
MASEGTEQGPSQPIPSCLDATTLKQLLALDDGQTELLKELFGLFKDDTPNRMEGMKKSMAVGDATATSELAHALKGAAGTIGADRMRRIAQDIEKACKAGRVDQETSHWLEELEVAYTEACAALDAFIERP